MAVPYPWYPGHSSNLRRPPPLPSRVGRSGDAKARHPFRGPPAALAAPVANERVPGRSPPDGVLPLLRVGGCLSAHWTHWQTIGADTWVLSVLRDGYRIPFQDSPPLLSHTPISFPTYRVGSLRSLALHQEVEKMLSKDALEIVLDMGPGFYSRLFLVEKVTGGWRPVIDLSHLNEFVLQTPFRMKTVASVLLSVRERDFLASIDLKDEYFQIPTHQWSRKLLRFLSEGTVFQFKALYFRLSTAPQVFTRMFAALSAWAYSHGISLLRYLDDWLVLASSEAEAQKGCPGSALSLSLPWDSDKRGEVRSRPLANCKLPRYDHRYRGCQDFSVSCADQEISVLGEDILYYVCSLRSALAGGFGTPGFAGETSSSQLTSNAHSAIGI